jgi:GntR family transcriptional regulator
MKFTLRRNAPLGIKDQIKRQIRIMAETGELPVGQTLPSAKDMAKVLNVNRNTVSTAYRELVAEGVLETIVGSGTFVKGTKVQGKTEALRKIVDEALEKAVCAGFSPEQITDTWLHRLFTFFAGTEGRHVLVVECNQEALDEIAEILRKDLSVETRGLLMDALESAPDLAAGYLSDIDLVVCGFNHVEEFKRIVPECPVEMVAVVLKSEVRILHELMRLPAGTAVGFTCVSQRSTESFYKEAIFSGGSSLIKIWAGMDNDSELLKMLEKCQVIFASAYVYDRILEMVGEHQRVIKVDLGIDKANINLIRERLMLADIPKH